MITIKDLSFRYRPSARESIDRISLHVDNGEVLGIVGPSQAGKTTLAYAVAGLLQKHFRGGEYSGSIHYDGDEIRPDTSAIGFVFQDAALQLSGVTGTVAEEIAFSLEQFGFARSIIRDRIEEQLSLFHLQDLRTRHPRTLSGGETQMLAIASEAAKHPRVFIFDEPTRSLDPGHIRLLSEYIRTHKQTSAVILIEQNINFVAELCDQVLFLENGRQRFLGSPQALLNSATDLSSLLVPETVAIQRLLGREDVTLSYKETVQWLATYRTSR